MQSAAIIENRTIPAWLEQHLEDFVRKRLGRIPNIKEDSWALQSFIPNNVKRLREVWEAAKRAADGHTMLLAGRDVWIFEVLARCENYPTVYRQDISRSTVRFIADNEDLSHYYLIDTGYRGTIPATLKINNWKLLSYCSNVDHGRACSTEDKEKHQLLWPNTNYVYLAGTLEACPKYYQQAIMRGPISKQEIYQGLEGEEMFGYASMVTRIVATGHSPVKGYGG